ncbi:MAG: site-specific integrase [Nevskiaceae bacterium]|jgi:integrase|nr:site-specific integrase [Nevskiaceae bacterium]
MLHDDRGLPLFYPTLFATTQLRNAGVAFNTIRNKLADIVVLLRWEQQQGRDLTAEFMHGEWLSLADIVSLRDFAKLNMRALGTDERVTGTTDNRAVDFLEARVALRPALTSVAPQQHYNRLTTIADYLEFVATVLTQHRGSAHVVAEITRMAKTIRKHRPRGLASRKDDLDRLSPPSELVDRFMAIGAESHPQNPFHNPGVRLRNALIFGLLRYTGLRRGELLSLRIDQFELGHEPHVWIRRNQDDVHDSRRYQPVTKTKERPLPLPEAVAEQAERYIMQVRARLPPARRHPYLLVSHRKDQTLGQPLSTSALSSQIFSKMRTIDPAFSGIHPHAFRHYFNYELSVSIDNHNVTATSGGDKRAEMVISEAREADVRAFLNGHRSRASGAAYNRRHICEASDRAIRLVQAQLRQKNGGGGKSNE